MRALVVLLSFAVSLAVAAPAGASDGEPAATAALEALTLARLDGSPMSVDQLRGKTVLFVNVASKCGLTPQYEALQKLYQAHAEQGLVVVGVPCNQFGAQEPGKPEEIATFCKMNYGVTFPLLEKQEVNGPGRSPLYRWLIGSEAGGGADISWNFEKFVVGRDGAVLGRFSPRTAPNDPALLEVIRRDLARDPSAGRAPTPG